VRTLYICYLSLNEPLVQSQVLPYLRELVSGGIEVHLLTFEKDLKPESSAQLAAGRQNLAAQGIAWSYLPYHKRPSIPATFYDVIRGVLRIGRLVRRHGIDVLHARAHIPMAMVLLARRFTRCATIFDLRGLIAEEYVDAGIWKEGSVPFKAIKSIERAGLRGSNQVVVLTERVRAWLVNANPALASKISVIPCCVDRARFADTDVLRDRFELVYAGSVVGLYLLEEMGRFFVALQRLQPNARFRILTHGSQAMVSDVLQGVGISANDFEVVAVDPGDVPKQLQRARLGISLRKPTFSQIAASPTKIAEYLAAGIPVVSNAGTGDVDELLKSERVGLTVHSFGDVTLAEAATKALALTSEADIEDRCRQAAAGHFDLAEIGGNRYREVYRRIEDQCNRSKTPA
jgi:glycosyltransferase involved in cell wall biosynthesis